MGILERKKPFLTTEGGEVGGREKRLDREGDGPRVTQETSSSLAGKTWQLQFKWSSRGSWVCRSTYKSTTKTPKGLEWGWHLVLFPEGLHIWKIHYRSKTQATTTLWHSHALPRFNVTPTSLENFHEHFRKITHVFSFAPLGQKLRPKLHREIYTLSQKTEARWLLSEAL